MAIHAKNPILLSVNYLRANRDADQKECFEVVYLDDQGKPQLSYEKPEADIYFVKPECRNFNYTKPEEKIENLYKVRTSISNIRKAIAKEAGPWGKMIVDRANSMHDRRYLNQLYKWPYCYGCDFQPEFYFMREWYKQHKFTIPKLNLAFLDIETDILDYMPDNDSIPDTAYAPVNLATVILDETNDCYTFILKPKRPNQGLMTEEQYQERLKMYERQNKSNEFLMGHQKEFVNDLHDSFDKTYGNLHYHLRFYDEEIELIADIFRLINTRKPNFCLSWNMRFDIQYLYYRIQMLGYDPTDIMTHPDFKYPRCYFVLDKRSMEFGKQTDIFQCSSYTMYICQMRLYAAIRKSQHKMKSMKLNAIADTVLKDKKVEYPENSNIRTFPYVNWLLFIKYNIKDVLLQFGIEHKVKDITTYYARSNSNNTPYNKIFKETHLLRNVREMYFEDDGWVQSNNLNIIDDSRSESEKRMYGDDSEEESESSDSYKGAINAEPTMNDFVGLEVLGHRTNNIFHNVFDCDMGSFYPSNKIASNMDPITLLYKASFHNDEFISGEFVNRSLNQTYREKDKTNKWRDLDITGEAVNTYAGQNLLTFGYNYLNIPNLTSIYDIVSKLMDQ